METLSTRDRIVAAANRLFYREGIRAVSVDAVAEEAGLTKRSLYYHFRSKDDLIEAYLAYRDQPNLDAYRKWYDDKQGSTAEKIAAIFENLAKMASHSKWKGCGFLRTSAELANLPGHPAILLGAAHKKKIEQWLTDCLEADGVQSPEAIARQIILLLDGSFAVVMLHRDTGYMLSAAQAAHTLVDTAPRTVSA
ncbi:TetR/AcrR family transcriptional regulator [Rhizobium sp.]